VRVKLTPQEQAHLGQVHPVDPEAYEAYLKGRYLWNRRSGEGYPKAVQYFQEAIAKDPTYAAAYAGLADCLSSLGFWGVVHPSEGCGKAKGLAQKALEIDPSSAEAHASLAFATVFFDHDFVTAAREFERSLELNPLYVTAHTWFGFSLAIVGRHEEAFIKLERAIQLDPCSSPVYVCLGVAYWAAHRYDQAIEQFEKAIELVPSNALAYGMLGLAYLCKSLYQPAITAWEQGIRFSQGASSFVAALGETYAEAGNRDAAQTILEQLQELSNQQYVTPYMVARLNLALGKRDEALGCLEAGYQGRDSFMVFLKVDPRIDDLRSDPRFQDLLRRMNFSA